MASHLRKVHWRRKRLVITPLWRVTVDNELLDLVLGVAHERAHPRCSAPYVAGERLERGTASLEEVFERLTPLNDVVYLGRERRDDAQKFCSRIFRGRRGKAHQGFEAHLMSLARLLA